MADWINLFTVLIELSSDACVSVGSYLGQIYSLSLSILESYSEEAKAALRFMAISF